MSPQSGQPVVLGDGGVRRPTRIDVTDSLISEDYIQKLVHEHPELLPIDEVSPGNGPLVSLGREIASGAGPIDNLLVSPRGELTLVEAKLWRNPEARRKVVAQVLDYAAALGRLGYEELDRLVQAKNDGRSMWELVSSSPHAGSASEAEFVDTVTRNLRSGRMLLLIVGDGIREDVENLVDIVGRRPEAMFHLELVELRLYEFNDGERLVIPRVVGRTNEVVRAVVDVRTDASGQVQVTVEPQEATPETTLPISSADEFLHMALTNAGEPWRTHVDDMMTWWAQLDGAALRFNQSSVTLVLNYRHYRSGWVPILGLYVGGTAEFANTHFCREPFTLFDEDEFRSELQRRGFGGKIRVSYATEILDVVDEVLKPTLVQIGDVVEQANNSEIPGNRYRLPLL